MLKADDLFDLDQTDHASIFSECEYAWDALKKIKSYISEKGGNERNHTTVGDVYLGDGIYIGEGTVLEDGVMIKGPAIIGRNCQLRHNAYLRENVIIGDHCVVGNGCELKNVLLFNHCQVPHFNYVGDSIFGHKAHLGAGVKISNVKIVPGNVTVPWEGEMIDTGLRKFGALLGDHTEVGCNSVLNPGTIIGKNCVLYPNLNWRGLLASNQIAKNQSPISVVEKKQKN